MNLHKASIRGYKDNNVDYLLIRQEEPSTRLAVVLPGAGYTAQAPLLHFATDICLQQGYDVLTVNYRYNDAFYDDFTMEEISDAIRFDVNAVIDAVMAETSYNEYSLIGKSLGTIAMASALARPVFHNAKTIWLTPLIQRPDVFDAMHSLPNQAIGFIGDEDPNFDAGRFEKLKTNPQLDLRLVPGTDHSLKLPGQPLASIDVLKEIMSEIEKFQGERRVNDDSSHSKA
ncbi:alpha/beta hydrolase [Planococcus beigongshangi]|uniref:alpha/beta hydrolase n=1 Tax=Planococcus beigongshangi TaxID=2782536 RepID=UPI00193C3570|nr:alpha/beta hydrolase [Planococcus beigongshangi]